MTIRDYVKTTAYIVEFIRDEAEKSGTKRAVVGVSGGIDSALILALCVQAFGSDKVTGVLMPCHSSKDSIARGQELVHTFGVESFQIDLSGAFNAIQSQGPRDSNKMADAALRSCLRAPTLDYIAMTRNALVYGTGNRDEDAIFRYYQKRGDGAVDNNPIVALHKSEVYELAAHLGVPASILKATPSADLWGPESGQEDEKELGITYPEIEWVTRETERNTMTLDHSTPREELEIFRSQPLTEREWIVIERARLADRSTAHKAKLPPGTDRFDMVRTGCVI